MSKMCGYSIFKNCKRTILPLVLALVSFVAFIVSNNTTHTENALKIHAENNGLKYLEKYVKFKTSKKVYQIGEKVAITIENVGDRQIKLSRIGNPEISSLAIYKIINDSKAVVVHNPRIGEIALKPGEKLSWDWDMKSFGEFVTPGEYAVGIDYNDLSLQVEGYESMGTCTSTVGVPVKSLRAPFTKFVIVEK